LAAEVTKNDGLQAQGCRIRLSPSSIVVAAHVARDRRPAARLAWLRLAKMTLPAARQSLLNEKRKIKIEQVLFYAVPG
jgi:hypothetical protein